MIPSDVPAGPVLLDTDVFSLLVWQKGRWSEFGELVEGHPFVLSFATVGELRAGALKAFGEKRQRELEKRIAECVVVPATDLVVWQYAELHARYRDQLKKDGSNDMWTAACALTQEPPLPVATGNRSDFELMADAFPLEIVHPDRDV